MKNRLISLSLLILIACSGSESISTDRGSTYAYRDGFPEVRVSAVGYFNEDGQSAIRVVADIVKGSLVYRNVDGISTATATVTIQVSRMDERELTPVSAVQIPIQIEITGSETIRTSNIHTLIHDVVLGAGEYEVAFLIMDDMSKQQTIRRSLTSIPDQNSPNAGLTGIRLTGSLGNDGSDPTSITTYDVQNRYRKLHFDIQVTTPLGMDSVDVKIELYKYESDTSYARDLAGIPVTPGSLIYKGVEFSSATSIMVEHIRIPSKPEPTAIRHTMDIPQSGNYRMDFSTVHKDGTILNRAREFSVKSAWYPNVRSILEMAEPLAYLMSRREYERMMAIQDPDSMKLVVDRFWLDAIRNRSKAAQVIELYYNRVEEANKQFTNFKEGWKTDMGMMYILFGPPWYVENTLDTSIWFYSYNRNDPRFTFLFNRPRIADQYFPFQHYILQRNQAYHNIMYDRIQVWKSGLILNEG